MQYNINAASDGGIFGANATSYQPGDVINLSGNYSYIYFEKLKGTASNPIILQATGPVTLSNGFDFKDCQFVKLNGLIGGVKSITIDQNNSNSSAVAVSIHGYSSDIEVSGLIIKNCGYGSWCKNEEFTDANLSNWVLNNISFHDFEMYNLASHGFYYGATEYPNKSRPVQIDGVNVYYNPSMLGNIKIYNGIIRSVGRNGVMLCIAATGQNEIYNIDADVCGLENNDQQGAGIQLGGFTSCYVHNNTINHTYLHGIKSFGGDTVRIENNVVSNSGNNTVQQLNWPQNICIAQDPNYTGTMFFTIKNNQLSFPAKDVGNIQVYKGTGNFSDKNEICGNTGTVTVEAGISYLTTTCSPVVTPPPTPTPVPAPVVVDKGFYTDKSGKRVYWLMYSDHSWKEANSKYQPL